MNQEFIAYNTHLDLVLEIGDAIKVTSNPQMESFWVEITNIYENKTFDGKIKNILNRQHDIKYDDIIQLHNKYIKEYKNQQNRYIYKSTEEYKNKLLNIANNYLILKSYNNNLQPTNIEYVAVKYSIFIKLYNRIPTENEFSNCINTSLKKK